MLRKLILLFLIVSAFCFYVGCSSDNVQSPTSNLNEDLNNVSGGLGKTIDYSYVTHDTFISSMQSFGFIEPDDVNLNRTASASGYNSVYGFNIPSANQVTGFKWNSGDEATEAWWPQGITGFNWGGKKWILVTWYSTDHKGARVSLVDITNMSNIKYRLILLVQWRVTYDSNDYVQGGLFRPIDIHAGGVTYRDGKIFVASTDRGLRIFDLSNIVEVNYTDATDTCGVTPTGDAKAFGYRYILPQMGYYRLTGGTPYSCVELGEGNSSTDMRFWTGQYLTSGSPVMLGFEVDANGYINTTVDPMEIDPIDKYGGSIYRVQGVFRKSSKNFLVHTGNSVYYSSTARLSRYNDGASGAVRYRWPHGAEDLYYESATGYLWCVTEYPTSSYNQDNRCVFAVRYSDYD